MTRWLAGCPHYGEPRPLRVSSARMPLHRHRSFWQRIEERGLSGGFLHPLEGISPATPTSVLMRFSPEDTEERFLAVARGVVQWSSYHREIETILRSRDSWRSVYVAKPRSVGLRRAPLSGAIQQNCQSGDWRSARSRSWRGQSSRFQRYPGENKRPLRGFVPARTKGLHRLVFQCVGVL